MPSHSVDNPNTDSTCKIPLEVCSVVILSCIWAAPQKSVSFVVSSNAMGQPRDGITGWDEIFRPVNNPNPYSFWENVGENTRKLGVTTVSSHVTERVTSLSFRSDIRKIFSYNFMSIFFLFSDFASIVKRKCLDT